MFIGSGTVINMAAVVAGAGIGAVLAHRFTDKVRNVVTDGLGLITLANGGFSVASLMKPDFSDHVPHGAGILILLGSVVGGGVIGSLLGIELRLERIGEFLRKRLTREGSENTFTEGFLAASLLFSIGPLAMMGSISDGLGNGNDQLILKSCLDFFASIAFASTFGWGVAASAISVGLVQGTFTLIGKFLGDVIALPQVLAMDFVGGMLLLGIGINLLGLKRISVGDMMPALVIAPLITGLVMF